jgi:creatinine amidohydrolase/Fe(II)-dependent formamide hydrolase-like protein
VAGSPTQLEIAQAQAAGCTILPVVLAGGFGDAVPSELSAVLGTSCATTAAYCEFVPGLIANLLGLGTTANNVLDEHAGKLQVLKAALSKQDPNGLDMAGLAAAHQEQVR